MSIYPARQLQLPDAVDTNRVCDVTEDAVQYEFVGLREVMTSYNKLCHHITQNVACFLHAEL